MEYSSIETLNSYKQAIDDKLSTIVKVSKPSSLYEPVKYAVEGGGKRIRPIILLAACAAGGGNPEEALDAAVAVELIHTFTLVHDDIMDGDTLRRGRDTIHKKWDSSSAILSGDAIFVLGYQSLLRTKTDKIVAILELFNEGVLGVCEGQALDIELEMKENVSNSEYLEMIEKKTGMMISMAAAVGALIGGVEPENIENFKRFGIALGKAFQLQDDYLEITSSKSIMGKSLGSDLAKGKKTFLLINAFNLANEESKQKLNSILEKGNITTIEVERVRNIFEESGVLDLTKKHIDEFIGEARTSLEFLSGDKKGDLLQIIEMIQNREK